MKKRSHSFRKKNLISIVFCIIASIVGIIISSMAFLPQAIREQIESEEVISIYNETEYDYVIESYEYDKLDSIKKLSSVKEFALFYNVLAEIDTPTGEVNTYIRSLVDDSLLQLTEFNDCRLLRKIDNQTNCIYISESFAHIYNYSLGDSIRQAGIDFIITRIYKNPKDSMLLYIPNFAEKINEKHSYNLSVKGIYIKCTNKTNFYYEIENMKNIIIDNKMNGYEESMKNSEALVSSSRNGYIFFGLLSASIYLIGIFVYLMFFSKRIKKEIVDNGKEELLLRNIYSNSFGLILSIIASIIAMIVIAKNISSFINIFNVLSLSWLSYVFICLAPVLAFVLELLFIESNYKRIN